MATYEDGIKILRPTHRPTFGTDAADQLKNQFVGNLLRILGDCRFLWMPKSTETTTSTDLSRYGATLTYDATFANQYVRLGSGLYATFDVSADEGDAPDNDRYTFGDSVVDSPFSIVALVNADDETPAAQAVILSKFNQDTDGEQREWQTRLGGTDGFPGILLYDESANAFIGREDQTVLTVTTWTLLAFTYDGSGAATGINVLKNAVVVDDADIVTGSYTAMENTTAVLMLGHSLSAAATPVAANFWDGGLAFVALTGKALSVEENWELKELVNGFYDLTL